jgi:hypothetical protein
VTFIKQAIKIRRRMIFDFITRGKGPKSRIIIR